MFDFRLIATLQHCNVTPDNWTLTTQSSPQRGTGVLQTDLMLMDFMRAIDLTDIKRCKNDTELLYEQNWMDQVFTGDTTSEASKCVSKRLGLPWSFDIDTFGICASIYLLIHGISFDIQQYKEASGAKKWMPKLKFPRHFQIDLWTEIFDTLLNLDEDFGRAIGSRPYNLKRLRKQIEGHLQTGNHPVLLDAAFRYQFSILSKEDKSTE